MAKNKDKGKTEKAEPGPLATHERWLSLLVSGDYRAARSEAAKALADPGASEADKAAAREVLQRTGIERGALAVVLVGIAVLLVIVALVFL